MEQSQLSDQQKQQIQEFVNTFPEEEREAKFEEVLSQLTKEAGESPATPQCPFCLMAEGKIPTNKVFEDKDFIAVLEINPANPGHALVIPKLHVKTTSELGDLTPHFLLLANSVASSLLKFNPGVNVLLSEGSASGKKFEHLVINVIPRKEGDEVKITWKPQPVDEKELEQLSKKIAAGMITKAEEPVKQEEEKVDIDAFKERMLSPEKRSP